jgi:CheY-like chemotaxis protein
MLAPISWTIPGPHSTWSSVEAEALMAAEGHAREVLVVDDDVDCLEALRFLLQDEGYHVEVARHGQEALDYFRQGGRPAVVILDLLMPVMDGLEFLRRRRDDPVLSSTPVIVLTATDARLGSQDEVVLRKPVDFPVLVSKIERACSSTAGGPN